MGGVARAMSDAAKCDSCGECGSCQNDLKGAGICRKYHTRVLEIFDGNLVQFHCVINNRFSDWCVRADIDHVAIAAQLHVRPKDVWKLRVSDGLPDAPPPSLEMPNFDVRDDPGKPFKPEEKQNIRYRVTQWLLGTYHFVTVRGKNQDEIYLYHPDGIYKPDAETLIVETIRKVLGEYCSAYDRNEVRAAIRDMTLHDFKVFTHHSEKLVCLENGIINVDTFEFSSHSPDQYFLSKLPVKYDPEATCPKIDTFFEQIVRAKDFPTLYEIVAYCVYPAYPIHRAVMLVGDGANGKSTFLELLKEFLGRENVSSLSLQQLAISRFATSALIRKTANVHADIPNKPLTDTGVFKQLVGGDTVGAEIKFGQHLTFANKAKMIFSANKLPKSNDQSIAFFRRWLIIVFPYIFTEFSDPKVDPTLLEKLVTPQQLSGLLNRALKALNELLDRNRFHSDAPVGVRAEEWQRQSSPIAAFFLDCLLEVDDNQAFLTKSEVYQAFVTYCKDALNYPTTILQNIFSREIKIHFTKASDSTAGKFKGPRARVWRNLTWSKEWLEEMEKKTKEGQPTLDESM